MYCPKCGVQNFEDAKFCRACGADISLVPQAMTKLLPEGAFGVLEVEEQEEKGRKGRKYKFKEPPTFEKGLESIFEGIAFMVIFMIGFHYFWGGIMLWIWAIIPAFGCVGKGIGELVRARNASHALSQAPSFRPETAFPVAPPREELHAPDTAEMAGHPLSVTEGTTRHLDATRPTRN